MLAQNSDHIHLFLVRETSDGGFNDPADGVMIDSDKTRIVEEGDGAHDELAVHAVCHASMAGNGVAKVLDLECSFQSRGKESTKGCDERGKGSENKNVELYGHDVECPRNRKTGGHEGESVVPGQKDRIRLALETRPNVGTKVLFKSAL